MIIIYILTHKAGVTEQRRGVWSVSCNESDKIELASGHACRVVKCCGCGGVRVIAKGMSLDLNAKAFMSIAWTFEQAALKLVKDQSDLDLGMADRNAKHLH